MNSPYTPKVVAAAIVGVLTPLILILATFLANEAQTVFGMDLEGTALAVYITGFLLIVVAALVRLVEHVAKALVAKALRDIAKVTPAPVAATAAVAAPKGGEN